MLSGNIPLPEKSILIVSPCSAEKLPFIDSKENGFGTSKVLLYFIIRLLPSFNRVNVKMGIVMIKINIILK